MDSMNTVAVDHNNAARQRRGTVPRKHEAEHPDDIGVDLAPAVTADQLRTLRELGYRGPTPSTAPQAAAILRRLQGMAAPGGETEVPRHPT